MDRRLRLNKLFGNITNGTTPISPSNGPQFLEALYTLPEPAETIGKLVSSKEGLTALKTAIRYDLQPKFFNTHASSVLQYLQAPELVAINNGEFLDNILMKIVDPPIFWTEFRKSFLNNDLDDNAIHSLGWLLLRLCTQSSEHATIYREDKDMPIILNTLFASSSPRTHEIAAKIREALRTSLPADSRDQGNDQGEFGPGGRHDNDFADFRKISILPTGQEIDSKEIPFMRPSSVLENPEQESSRVAIHLDNQFRILREDMLYEMREELQILRGEKKGRHRGVRINGLRLIGMDCGDEKKRLPWSLICVCDEDFPEMKKLTTAKDRRDFLDNKRQFFKHQSQACLLVDKEIIAFPCIHRDEERLAKNPPEIVLQFKDAKSTQKALLSLKMENGQTLIQIDTATFAYEPVLRALQQAKTLPLSAELLLWKKGDLMEDVSAKIPSVVHALRNDFQTNLKDILKTKNDIRLDKSQAMSLISGLTQKVSLIQGPPGTGKSFIGALMAKAIHNLTTRSILVVCYTNHALDDILTSLLDIGIPESSMLRLGGKSTQRTEPLSIQKQDHGPPTSRNEWIAIDELKSQFGHLRNRLNSSFAQYMSQASLLNVLALLEMEFPDYFDAFKLPDQEDGMRLIGEQGRAAQEDYLINKWSQGQAPGPSFKHIIQSSTRKMEIWALPQADRIVHLTSWRNILLHEAIEGLTNEADEYNRCLQRLDRAYKTNLVNILRQKRIVGCTTTAAAKYREDIQTFKPDVLLVEEAGEILESHVLTSLAPETSQMILIGDHKQLRPRVNNYLLTVENGNGYDLNRSLFERLILKGYPHEALSQQHRMRPEISALIRSLTYPELIDAPKTQNRPDLRGVQDNIVFIQHEYPEDEITALADRSDITSTSSKQNSFEASMVLKIVKYLAQQGYGTEHLVVLTPYLGQLQKLRQMLKADCDPVLNDLDNNELIKAGLVDPSIAKLNKRQIRLATIDNYQGEESDVVIVSLTRSNVRCDIGFMFAPERLNVLLSRARNAMIILGNSDTFTNAWKGKELWEHFFRLLALGNHLYGGLPVMCEKHPHTKSVLSQPDDFDIHCPEGGCLLPCGVPLSCNLHKCPSKCHQLSDHSKVPCAEVISSKCLMGHPQSWKCSKGPPPVCQKCERARRLARQKQQDELEAQIQRDAEQKAYLEKIDALNTQIEQERRSQEEASLSRERAHAIKQKQADLESMKAFGRTGLSLPEREVTALGTPARPQASKDVSPTRSSPSLSKTLAQNSDSTSPKSNSCNVQDAGAPPSNPSPQPPSVLSFMNRLWNLTKTASIQNVPIGKPFKDIVESPSQIEWKRQKNLGGAQNDAIDSIMDMIGLEAVKEKVLDIKAKIDTNVRQNATLKHERFNVVLLGNPGTGKTTVARHYAKFLANVRAIPGQVFEETTGARLAEKGVGEAESLVQGVIKAGGGAIFIDEAYQLTSGHHHGGPAVLDFLLAEMENRVGTLVFILAGYNKEMEKFFEHNLGLKSRVPYQFKFSDYKDEELMSMFNGLLQNTFGGGMKVDNGVNGLFGRIAIRRLGRRRGTPGFGNARDLQTVFSQIRERQAVRLNKARKEGRYVDYFFLTQEDLIGPAPSEVLRESEEWAALQGLIGLKAVKDTVKSLFNLIEENFHRELLEQEVLDLSLNKVFLGSPGTGKTTVAKLYGKILADVGLLSNGEVVLKNPSDFIGAVLGASEANTKAILANTVGKVLIIDEAYMLHGGGSGGDGSSSGSNQFKTSVIDTIVAEVQSNPGEDRCIILVGYKNQMIEMFENVNPGLSRRFKIEDAFNFDDFNDAQLWEILELKLRQQDLDATDQAKKVAIENLSRLRNRPNFGNGGEVDNILTRAKGLAIARRAKLPLPDRPVQIVFEAEDIDPDWNRIAKATEDLEKLFNDIVGCDDVVKRLKHYQEIVELCKQRDWDPRENIPTNFVFAGPPGTGKTTIARKIGQVYYNMGLLASPEVIESSASDLVGQYVGQTGPKTKKLFQKALGKVLFIDEAYRLGDGQFAQEAIDELVGLLTHVDFKGKLIVILAGYEKDMKRLMEANSGLTSRFPVQVPFKNMDAESCLQVISNELQKKKIETNGWDRDINSAISVEMKELIRDMAELDDWGNARDMINASKEMINRALVSSRGAGPTSPLLLSGKDALDVMNAIVSDRQRRSRIPAGSRRRTPAQLPQQSSNPKPPSAPSLDTKTATKSDNSTSRPLNGTPSSNNTSSSVQRNLSTSEQQAGARPPTSSMNSLRHIRGRGARGQRGGRGEGQRGGRGGSHRVSSGPVDHSESAQLLDHQRQGRITRHEQRDPGVSDAVWRQLGAAKRKAIEIEQEAITRIANLEREANNAKREEQRRNQLAEDLARAESAAREASERAALQRQREEARIQALAARAAREKADAELRAKKEAENLRQEKERKAQEKLREMGVCPAGYQWINMGSIYRCRGGSHVVSVHALGL